MGFPRFVAGTVLAAGVTFVFANWAQSQTDGQINKMQLSAYNTPGAEAPIPPAVLAAGMSTLSTLWFVQRKILRQSWGGAGLGVVMGALMGLAALYAIPKDNSA